MWSSVSLLGHHLPEIHKSELSAHWGKVCFPSRWFSCSVWVWSFHQREACRGTGNGALFKYYFTVWRFSFPVSVNYNINTCQTLSIYINMYICVFYSWKCDQSITGSFIIPVVVVKAQQSVDNTQYSDAGGSRKAFSVFHKVLPTSTSLKAAGFVKDFRLWLHHPSAHSLFC